MLRLLLFFLGVAFVAIVSLPGVSIGEHAMHGFQSITAPYVPAKRGPAQRGPIRVPQAPEIYPQTPATAANWSDGTAGNRQENEQGAIKLARSTHQSQPLRRPETEFISPPVVPDVSADPSMPQVLGGVLTKTFPDPQNSGFAAARSDHRAAATPNPSATVPNAQEPTPQPEQGTTVSSIPTQGQGKYKYLEIEVGYDTFVFKLYGVCESGQKDLLKECKVALGARGEGFDTPTGVYYVTHIYDEEPWWIPPPDRPWAWGQSRSKRVYGGTMAPLLKKRPVSSRKKGPIEDDYIEGPVKLDDNGYRFHGTNQPRSIGHRASHGCVRMLPKDAAEVANLIKEHVGAPEERTSENGKFVVLRAPVRLNIIK